jgi:hypothetical protein
MVEGSNTECKQQSGLADLCSAPAHLRCLLSCTAQDWEEEQKRKLDEKMRKLERGDDEEEEAGEQGGGVGGWGCRAGGCYLSGHLCTSAGARTSANNQPFTPLQALSHSSLPLQKAAHSSSGKHAELFSVAVPVCRRERGCRG